MIKKYFFSYGKKEECYYSVGYSLENTFIFIDEVLIK
jgi:hypothetical protein